MDSEDKSRTRLVSRLVKHGAKHVDTTQLVEEAQIIWKIGADEEVSDTCIHLEEFMLSAARSCRKALDVVERIDELTDAEDEHLLTALKKYVEDACAALKEVDDTLRRNNSSLAMLIYEIPDKNSESEFSWRSLIGRRDVIAHQLLTVDNERIYREAKRDFGALYQLISNIYFAPVKTSIDTNKSFSPLFKADAIRSLTPTKAGKTPKIGESLLFVCEDKTDGFLCFRLGRTEGNKLLLSAPRSIHLSVYAIAPKK